VREKGHEFTNTMATLPISSSRPGARLPHLSLHVFEREPVSYGKKRFQQMQASASM